LLPDGWETWNPAELDLLLKTLQEQDQAEKPTDPLGWAAEHDMFLWSMQRDVMLSVEASKRTVVVSGAGIGKSHVAARIAGWWIDTHPAAQTYVWTTAPSADQVGGILWGEMRAMRDQLALPGRIGLDNKWHIGQTLVASGRKPADKAKGAEDDPDTGQGYHRRYLLVILDDAGNLDEWLWDAAENVTTGDDCRILATGNPDHAGSRFAAVADHHPLWTPFTLSVFDSPNFTGEPVPPEVAASLTTRQWAADRKADWGEDDRRYLSKVLAKFPKDHPQQIVPAADLGACFFAEARSATELLPVELGVDVGGGGDQTIIRERRGVRGGRRWAKRTSKPEEAAPFVIDAIKATGATSVKIDSIGIGWGLAGELRNLIKRGDLDWECAIHVVMVSEASANPKEYHNLKAQIWWEIGRVGSQRREWDLSRMEAPKPARDQLLNCRWFPDAKNRVQVEGKADVKARTGGESPDDADALLLAYYVPRDGQGAYFAALTAGKLRG
jgi:hypothetical protein